MLRKLLALWLLLLAIVPRIGYGPRTYVPGLAILADKMLRYINKHYTALEASGDADLVACISGVIACLQTLRKYLNKSAA